MKNRCEVQASFAAKIGELWTGKQLLAVQPEKGTLKTPWFIETTGSITAHYTQLLHRFFPDRALYLQQEETFFRGN